MSMWEACDAKAQRENNIKIWRKNSILSKISGYNHGFERKLLQRLICHFFGVDELTVNFFYHMVSVRMPYFQTWAST